jgi:ribonuclease P protein component
MPQTFGKAYKLCSNRLIDSAFSEGSAVKQYPFKLILGEVSEDHEMPFSFQIVFSVPKRNVKSAVKRNLIKRRMKEAFRLNKNDFEINLTEKNLRKTLFLIYLEKEILSFDQIQKKMIALLEKSIKHLEQA